MSSFLTLELDTTSPVVEIYAPNETTTLTDTLYRIVANENLSNIQDFYFIDAKKQRHDVTLQYKNNIFEGIVSFDNFAEGMATFYVRVYDEVLNLSKMYVHYLNVQETRDLTMEIQTLPRIVQTKKKPRKVESIRSERLIALSLTPRKIDIEVDEYSGTEGEV